MEGKKNTPTEETQQTIFEMHPSPSPQGFFHHRLECRLIFSLALMFIIPPCRLAVPDFVSCSGDRNYTQFESNRDIVLSFLAASTPATGFITTTYGVDPTQVFGLALCRGDTSADQCRTCITNATLDAPLLCSGSVAVRIWYTYCFLRYTDWNFFGLIDHYERYQCAAINALDRELFNRQMNSLMTSLSAAAATDGRMFATGDIEYTISDRIYGLVQCTRDLSPTDCNTCLMQLVRRIPYFCNGTQGAQLSYGTCVVWYQTYRFFTVTDPRPLPPPLQPQPQSSDPGDAIITNIVGPANRKLVIILIAVICALSIISLVGCICIFQRGRRKGKENQIREGSVVAKMWDEITVFDFNMVRIATEDFVDRNKLGHGLYGPAYKAKLDGVDVAVKKLETSDFSQGTQRFMEDVNKMAKLQHANLVRIVGCSVESEERLLIYEYMINSSLDKFLFDPGRCVLLDWPKRLRIIIGVANGLHYLHENSPVSVVHKDLKASNILLDKDMNPKITHIDLERYFKEEEIHDKLMHLCYEQDYMAPEYRLEQLYSTQSDVFSFGVLLLEIVSGKRNRPRRPDLQDFVWRYWNAKRNWNYEMEFEIMDAALCTSCQIPKVMACIDVGLLCVRDSVQDRPTLSSVLLMLNGTNNGFQDLEPSSAVFMGHEWGEREAMGNVYHEDKISSAVEENRER